MRDEVRAEMDRAQKSLRAARLLCDEGLLEDAISRSYYAALHAAKAALLVDGIVAESQAAVRRLFGKVLVLPGRLEREWAAVIANEQDQRVMADYDAQAEWEPEAARGLVGSAQAFVDRIRKYLETGGGSTAGADDAEGVGSR